MVRPVDAKSNGNKKKRNLRKEKRSKQQKPSSKNATRPSDVYEAEEKDPEEELKAGQRYDRVDNYEYELPSDFEDEEIDEEAAFTAEDKKQFADWFAEDDAPEAAEHSENADEADLLNSESEHSEEEELNPDDFSEDEFQELSAKRKSASAAGARAHLGPLPSTTEKVLNDIPSDSNNDSDASSGEEEDEAEEAGDEEDKSRHEAMLAEVRGAVGDRKRKRVVVASEAYPDSEYNLPPTSASAGGQGELSIADLMKGLGDAESKMGPARKALLKMAKQAEPLTAPLPGPIRERQERKAGYETTKEDITKWQPLIKANREAPTLEFKSGRDEVVRSSTTAALAAKFSPDNDMEEEVAELLRAAGAHTGEAVEEAEEALALKALTVEEAQERRERLAKTRSLLFAHEQKAKRLKAIKSKGFHRHAKKAAKMKAVKAGETGDEDIIKLAAEDAELARAKERLTLKHRNSSKWARRALKRGMDVMDEGTKAAVAEQLRLGEELRRKVDRMDDKSGSEGSDSDASTSASDEEEEVGNGGNITPARKRAASNKARAAALDILQGGAEEEEGGKPKSGLFSLPFMTRAAERQRLNAQQEAAAVLAQLEAEDEEAAAGSDADVDDGEPNGSESGNGNAGRLTFGGGPVAPQARASDDEAASSSGEEEDGEAKAARTGKQSRTGRRTVASKRREQDVRPGASDSRRKKKRARDADNEVEEDAQMHTRLAMSNGPLAVDDLAADEAAARDTGTASTSYASLPDSSQRTLAAHDRAFGSAPGWGTSLQPSPKKPQKKGLQGLSSAVTPGQVHIGPLSTADRTTQQAEEEQQKQQSAPKFIQAKSFEGRKAGFAFKKGSKGLGYYLEGDKGRAVVKPKQAVQAEPVVSEDEEQGQMPHDADDSDADMQPAKGIELSQAELIKRAFAGDDVQADFEAAKAAEVEEELPKQEEVSVLPGWGTWANQQKEPHWIKAANQKAQRQKEAAAANRKDSKLKAVVISEAWDKKAGKYNALSVPFPFDSKATYEQSMRTPMGREFNTTAAHRDMTRPAVIKHSGMIIDPIQFNKSAADSAKQTKSKDNKKMKISVSAGIPRPSRR